MKTHSLTRRLRISKKTSFLLALFFSLNLFASLECYCDHTDGLVTETQTSGHCGNEKDEPTQMGEIECCCANQEALVSWPKIQLKAPQLSINFNSPEIKTKLTPQLFYHSSPEAPPPQVHQLETTILRI